VGFIDAGSVFPSFRDLSLRALAVGGGGGLRVETPFGLVRADFGMPVPRLAEAPMGRWFFSIGQAF
jgi:outer membrane translocation and assembly module TamA